MKDAIIKVIIVVGIIMVLTSILYASNKRDANVLEAYENCYWLVDIDDNYQAICE